MMENQCCMTIDMLDIYELPYVFFLNGNYNSNNYNESCLRETPEDDGKDCPLRVSNLCLLLHVRWGRGYHSHIPHHLLRKIKERGSRPSHAGFCNIID
jgi:hypothetical protein